MTRRTVWGSNLRHNPCAIAGTLLMPCCFAPVPTLPPWPSDALQEAVMRACAGPPDQSGILRPPTRLPSPPPPPAAQGSGGGVGSLDVLICKGWSDT